MQMDNVLNRKEKSEFTKAITTCFKGLSASLKDPFMQYRITNWNYIRKVRKAARYLRSFSQKCFNERRESILRGDYTQDDILNHLVKMKIDNPDLDEEVILDDITTFFVAGQETTACLLSFVMTSLWQNKDVMKRLREHVMDIIGYKPYISMEDTDKMTYLDMVIKECLRLYPPGPNTSRQIKHDVDMMGYHIPAGTIVFMSTYVSSRLEEFFPDPLKFDPERFSPNAENKIPSFTYYPFTIGPRTCIGRNFAEVEAKIILAKIMQRFEFEMDPDQDFSIEESLTLKPKGGAVCTLTLYDSSSH